jgi:flagellar motor protein MotB
MKVSWMGLVALGLVGFISSGCTNKLKQENATLRNDNAQLKGRLVASESARQQSLDPAQYQAMQNELAAREARIKELEGQLKKPEVGQVSDPAIEGIATSYDRSKGELTVSLPSDILFAPGSADLKSTSKGTLDKVIAALRLDYAGKKVRVEGHTDKDPVARSADKWIDNLDLSQNRAGAVARYLMEKGLERKNVVTIGHGDAQPKASKAASRRVEIVVVAG